MAIKTFRIWVSGKISPRHSNIILHQMLDDLGFAATNEGTFSDQTSTIRNMHRENEEGYFDVDIPIVDEENEDVIAKVEAIKRYVVENSVQYQDITNEPPKDM